MPLQNSQASQAVLAGQEYWRLHQELQSSGDIFEIDESTKQLYIGQLSDIAEVKLTYYDPKFPSALAQTIISPGSPFTGRFDSLQATSVPSTGQRARILATPNDIIDNAWVPAAPALLIPPIVRIKPKIDLISVLRELPQIPVRRTDFTYRNSQVLFGANGPTANARQAFLFPFYGRRLFTMTISLPVGGGGATGTDVSFEGVNLGVGGFAGFPQTPSIFLKTFTFAPPVSVPQSFTATIRVGDTAPDSIINPGAYDLMFVTFAEKGAASVTGTSASIVIRTSDQEV